VTLLEDDIIIYACQWRSQGGGAIGQLPNASKIIAQRFFEMITIAECQNKFDAHSCLKSEVVLFYCLVFCFDLIR